MIELARRRNVSLDFVSSHIVQSRGLRDAGFVAEEAQQVMYEAMKKGLVRILISDGQADATMKGFGDTRDNIPAILELSEKKVVSLRESVAMMTINPLSLLVERTGQDWWLKELGLIMPGYRANITIIDPLRRCSAYTIVNGKVVAFEGRAIRECYGAGYWVSRYGLIKRTGVGDLTIFTFR